MINFIFGSDLVVAGYFQLTLTKCIIKVYILVRIRCSRQKRVRLLAAERCEVFMGHIGADWLEAS